jgi:acetolactate decarboxylase
VQPAARDLVDHRAHPFFQASTVEALFEGKLEGDLTFAELAGHGDLGIGTLNGLDGEMIALDGRFMHADADGAIDDVPPEARTPFAVVTFFEPVELFAIEEVLDHDAFLERLDRRVPPPSAALRIDGEFEHIRARSVPRQRPPYRSLAEVANEQHVFEFSRVVGTMVGFRFPDSAGGIEVPGYHLHFVDAERERGGHVLACRPSSVEVRVDPSSELRVELPPGVELDAPGPDEDQIRGVEGGG